VGRGIHDTVGHGLRYASNVDMRLQGYVHADWTGSAVDRKSTSGCRFTLGSAMVSYCSRKQTYVALSTAEAEYIALCVPVDEAVWLRKLLAYLFGHEMDSIVIHCDNQSCVKLSENHVFHDKSKHIEIKYHYIRDNGAEENSTCAIPFYTRASCRCLHQTACQDEVQVLP
jgi:hypothetical protein